MVCFSGGQDSTTCLFWAKKHFKRVEAVCFTYGQKHTLEVEVARAIADEAHVPFHLLDVSLISQLDPNNSLVNGSITMDEEKPADNYPNTFVPGRNMVFLTFAAILARSKGIFHLVTGVSEADFSGYPDCRDTFIRSLNVTLNLAMDEQFVLHTPLMDRDKSEVWELSDEPTSWVYSTWCANAHSPVTMVSSPTDVAIAPLASSDNMAWRNTWSERKACLTINNKGEQE